MPTAVQIKKIHVLKNDLSLDDYNYRLLLGAYRRSDGGRVGSAKELSVPQASAVIKTLEHIVDATPELHSRVYASDKQIKMMFALWHRITGSTGSAETRRTLVSFLAHHFHIRDVNRIPRKKIVKVLYTLSIMARHAAHRH